MTDAELNSGFGEMLHYYIVSGETDFAYYKDNYKQAFTDKVVLSKMIMRSLEIKKQYVEADEFDTNIRQVFNYGHSFGHAIESLTQYGIPHGIAVSYGMDIANFVSVKKKYITEDIRNEIREVTKTLWVEFPLGNLDADLFITALRKDKKNVGAKLGLILNKGYGQIFKDILELNNVFRSWLIEYFEKEAVF